MNASRIAPDHGRQTIPRARSLLKTASGFALLTVGVPLLFLPGPGAPAIVLGLTLLGGQYPWASRALVQIERPTRWLRGALLPSWTWAMGRFGMQRRIKKAQDLPLQSKKWPKVG